jgi:hypothetical protein
MTPKEKAEELVDKFTQTNGNSFFAKECALIAVDEILDDDCFDMGEEAFDKRINFWQQVKKEIEEL